MLKMLARVRTQLAGDARSNGGRPSHGTRDLPSLRGCISHGSLILPNPPPAQVPTLEPCWYKGGVPPRSRKAGVMITVLDADGNDVTDRAMITAPPVLPVPRTA